MATGLHGGLLFAFADQIGATSITRTQTEISILDLPSVSGTTRLDAKPLDRIQPKSDSRIQPVEKKETKRLENSAERLTAKSADNNAKLIEKISKRNVADTIKEASSVQPISSPKVTNNHITNTANSTAPIENKHETSETIASERLSETSSPATKVSKSQEYDVALLTSPSMVRSSLTNTEKTSPIESEHETSKTIASSKIAKTKSPTTIISESQEYNIALQTSPTKARDNQEKKILNLEPSQSAQSITKIKNVQITNLESASNAKRVRKTSVKLEVKKSTPPITQVKKTAPVSISKQKRSKSLAATANIKSSMTKIAITTSQKLKVTKAKPFNPVEISKNTVKQFTPKLNSTKLVSHIRIGRIKTVKSSANSNQASSNSTSIKVAILARPRQIVPKALLKPTNDQVDGFAKVVNFLKFYNSENSCFLALPSISSKEKMILSGFSNEKSSWPNFQKALAENTRFETPGRLASISDAQCQVITFARQSNSYPSYSVSLQLDYSSIKNGEFIAGKIFIDEGRYLNFLLVDDEGTAININRFVNIEKNNSTFQLQVNLTGGEVSTSQLLLAIVTDKTLDSMQSHEAIAVTELLNNIKKEVGARDINMDLALTAFVVN